MKIPRRIISTHGRAGLHAKQERNISLSLPKFSPDSKDNECVGNECVGIKVLLH